MFTTEERTEERAAAVVAALEAEREGYERRLSAVSLGFEEKLTGAQLEARIAGVDEQIAWAKGDGSKKKSGGKKS